VLETAFPASSGQLSLSWLQDCFAAAGVHGHLRHFRSEPLPLGVGLVAHLERVHLEWDDDQAAPRSVIAKLPALGDATRMVGLGLRMYEREARFYQRVARLSPMHTPAVYAAAFDPDTHAFILLLQDLEGRFVDQMTGCTISDAENLIDQVARHHVRFWNGADLAAEAWIPRLADSPYPDLLSSLFSSSWAQADELFGDCLNDAARVVGSALVTALPSVMARLSEPPFTFSHGDFRIDNVCFDQAERAWVFDWQLPDFSKGPRDVAYLLSQSVPTESAAGRHKELLARYLAQLERGGVEGYTWSVALDDYRLAVAFTFIIPVIAAASLNHESDRHLAVLRVAIERASAALDELDVPALFS